MSYERRCVAAVQLAGGGVDRCRRDSLRSDPPYLTLIPVCSWHFMRARSQFAAGLEAEVADLKRAAEQHVCDGERAVAKYVNEHADRQIERTARWRKHSLAYFIRCGQYVKIGASQSPAARLETIRTTGGVLAPDGLKLASAELVATETGGFDRERELHAKFSHLRHTGEWFTESPELSDYIKGLAA